jgi:class 3 adenylate cyclase
LLEEAFMGEHRHERDGPRHRPTRSLPSETGEEMLEGTVTVAFADVEDSTTLVQRLGDRRYAELIDTLGTICRALAEPLRGYVPRHEGDGWMLVFGSARRAARWACDLQHAVERLAPELPGETLRVRIGLHTGEALQRGRDFQGVHVNLAARVAAVAPGASVYVSSLTHRVIRGEPDFVFGQPTIFSLKGFEEPEAIYELDWRRLAEAPANSPPGATDGAG